MQMVSGGSPWSDGDRSSVKVKEQLLLSAGEEPQRASKLLVMSALRAFYLHIEGKQQGRLLLLLRHCKQSQFWECFELSGIEGGEGKERI